MKTESIYMSMSFQRILNTETVKYHLKLTLIKIRKESKN